MPAIHYVVRGLITASVVVTGFFVNSVASAECPDTDNVTNTCLGHSAFEFSTGGSLNTGIGYAALRSNGGDHNTAIGRYALLSNTTGSGNTASGAAALSSNTTGKDNTAGGRQALHWNQAGRFNSAFGVEALMRNISGERNTAAGMATLHDNSTGSENTAVGFFALRLNTTGDRNTATGVESLYGAFSSASTGSDNTANGYRALYSNQAGHGNTATGINSLFSNTDGLRNTANGAASLRNTTTGYRNVGLGYQAGFAITTGSDNIVIGAGNFAKAVDNGVIRIGVGANQKKTFIAGIKGVQTGLPTATSVLIDANGQLGTIRSSRQFKEDIQEMASVSEKLLALRPVTFRYKEAFEDGSKPIQFGLIAEEVIEVFPELVTYGGDGEVESVSYHMLATLILNEFQKEHRVVQDQTARIASLEQQLVELTRLKQEFARMAEAVERLDHTRVVATN